MMRLLVEAVSTVGEPVVDTVSMRAINETRVMMVTGVYVTDAGFVLGVSTTASVLNNITPNTGVLG